MPTSLTDVEIEEISILGKTSRPAVRAARICIVKRAEGPDKVAQLRGRVQILRNKVDAAFIKFDPDQTRDDHGRWTGSGSGGDSSDHASSGGSSAAKWFGRIADVAAIASLAIPGFAGVRAAKVVFDSTRQLLRTTAVETARHLATSPEARQKLVAEVTAAMAEKNNVAWSTAAGALSTVFGFLANRREAEISKADNRDPILEQLRLIEDALAALDTESDDTKIEKELKAMDFNDYVEQIRKRDNCPGTEALRKARQRSPEAFTEYNAVPTAKPGADHLQKHESAKFDFEDAVDSCVIEKRCTVLTQCGKYVSATLIYSTHISRFENPARTFAGPRISGPGTR